MNNVFISTDYVAFTVPAQHAHLARSWQEVCHLDRFIFVVYRPATSARRPFKVWKLTKGRSGFHNRSETRYATLDNAVRAAQRLASNQS
jgi:hypothetical protein